MPRTPTKTTPPAAAVPTHLVVRPAHAGFRRAGRAWPAGETTVALADLSAEQIEALLSEPLLATELTGKGEGRAV